MKKILVIITVILLVSQNIIAQNLSSSPYSRFGVGDILFQGNGRQIAMGNTGIADFSSHHISKVNPATYSALKPNNVIFETNFFHRFSEYSNGTDKQINNTSNFKQLVGGFRVTRWWHTAFGLTPYSGIGYQVVAEDSVVSGEFSTAYTTRYYGLGGITQLFWGNSFTILKNFSIGANINYNFGSMNKYSETVISDTLSTSITRIYDRNLFKKFTYDLGVIFQDTIKNGYKNILRYSIGGIYSNKFEINTYRTLYVSRMLNSYGLTYTDSVFFDTVGQSSIVIPQTYGGGISLTFQDKFTVSADYLIRKWKGATILDETNFVDSRFIGVGFEYVASPFSTVYSKTIRYRIGVYQNNSYKLFNDIQLQTQAITFGVGFPIKTVQLNLGFVIGQTGSLDIGLKENFYELNLSVSLYDLWFVKRKFM